MGECGGKGEVITRICNKRFNPDSKREVYVAVEKQTQRRGLGTYADILTKHTLTSRRQRVSVWL